MMDRKYLENKKTGPKHNKAEKGISALKKDGGNHGREKKPVSR